jgi:glyoxylase-like metal-dependent hydrolase (beta-lactamase superfamily II)
VKAAVSGMTQRGRLRALLLIVLALRFSPPAGLAQLTSQLYQIEELAPGVYLFSAYFYSNLFIVTSEGVIATDPISPLVAGLYARAIRSVTDQPVRYVIYSHDHTDHIAGGGVFAETAKFIAHENARQNLLERKNPNIVVPDITFKDQYTLELGGKTLKLMYFGENHSNSTIGILLPKERILMLVDLVYPGSVPFRDLPGTDVRKLLLTLERVRILDFDQLVYGHGPAGPKIWVDRYIAYLNDMIETVRKLQVGQSYEALIRRQQGRVDARRLLDLSIDDVAQRAVEELRPKYGRWGGYDEWAILNAKKIVLYLIMEE